MSKQPLNNQNFPFKDLRRRGRVQRSATPPWLLIALVIALHMVAGIFLSVFSPPFWVWPLAFGGTFIQTLALAGPEALSSLKGFRIILCRSLTCLGTALSVVALAVAVGFGGTNNIDDIRFGQIGMTLFFVNLGVLVLTAVCSLLIAHVGDRLLAGMGRVRSSLTLLSVCLLGLFIGGAFGLAIAS